MTTLKTLSNKVKCEATMVAKVNPEFPRSNAWSVTLKYQRRQLTVDFYTGYAISEPDSIMVLESLLMDANCADESFEDFCGNCGYDVDSRRAERIYKQILRNTKRLKRFLGSDYSKFTQAEM